MSANWQGSATSAEPQPTNTLDFWKHKIIPYPLHMGMGLCYNLLNKLEFDEVRQMTIQTVEQNNILCAVINSDEKVFTDAQSALDVLMTAKYNVGTKNIIIDKKLIVEDFFILSTGLAGEILQKYTNYGGRIAIYGDYSRYTSKPLRDFIYESNKGKSVFFVATKEEAIEMLTK